MNQCSGFSVLIPAHNESDRISATVRAALALPGAAEVIVVDDGSADATADEARLAGAAHVVVLGKNLGKGGALNAGLQVATQPFILMLDADLAESASCAGALMQPVASGEADMTVGVFPELVTDGARSGKAGGFGIALKVARWGITALTGRRFSAPLSGQRALSRCLIDRAGGFFPGFGVETALSGFAAAAGLRVLEVPLPLSHRRTGKNFRGAVHRARQLLHICRALIWLAAVRNTARRTTAR